MTLVICTGTATEVGKTWVGVATLRILRDRGWTVAARKPVQSSEPTDSTTDADLLAAATGEPPVTVCPPHRVYEVPMAPPMAASVLGRPRFTIHDLVGELTWPVPEPDVRWVETAGGVRSPLASDGADAVDLCRLLQPDVLVLVADAGLGAINAVRLSCAALSGMSVIVVLNRCVGELAERNRAWLGDVDGFEVVTDPGTLAHRLSTRG